MANDEHVALLGKDVDAWNRWRSENPNVVPDLRGALLGGADLREANLSDANLIGAKLTKAHLMRANLRGADLTGADLSDAALRHTVFASTTLTGVKGLDLCRHEGPSVIDFPTLRTLKSSDPLPT